MRHKPQCHYNDILGNPNKHQSVCEIKNCCFLFSLTDLSAIDLTLQSNCTKTNTLWRTYLSNTYSNDREKNTCKSKCKKTRKSGSYLRLDSFPLPNPLYYSIVIGSTEFPFYFLGAVSGLCGDDDSSNGLVMHIEARVYISD